MKITDNRELEIIFNKENIFLFLQKEGIISKQDSPDNWDFGNFTFPNKLDKKTVKLSCKKTINHGDNIIVYDPVKLGNALRLLRKSKNFSQTKLQKLCDVDHGDISRIERGNIKRTESIEKICIALGTTLNDQILLLKKD